jgi:hypothetical protein
MVLREREGFLRESSGKKSLFPEKSYNFYAQSSGVPGRSERVGFGGGIEYGSFFSPLSLYFRRGSEAGAALLAISLS